MSTRAWFILLKVCSYVGSVQLREFGASSFCLFPSREWNSVVLFPFFSSLPLSPWWWWNWSTNICLSWSNTFLYSAESSLFIQLSYCSVHLETQEKLQGRSSEKQNCPWEWVVSSPCTWQSLGSGKECEEQKSLEQSWPCLRPQHKRQAVWLLLTNICAGPALSKGAFGPQVCFPRGEFQLGGCRWNLAVYYNTNIANLLPWVYKEGEGATSFLWGWQWAAPKWSPSAVLAM